MTRHEPPVVLGAVLARFGLSAGAVEPLSNGAVNAHWRVCAGERVYALRRYNARHDSAGTQYEHDVLDHLAARGWPVAAPCRSVDGATVVEEDGSRYALFPFLPGSPAPARERHLLHTKGRLLARLHQALAGWPAPGQRPGFARVSDLDVYVTPDRFASLVELLEWVAREDAPLAEVVRRERARNLDELSAVGFERLADVLVHFEFYGANLLFQDGALSGLLDFDFVHLDARVADIGRSLAIDCAARGGDIESGALAAFLGGYVEESALGEAELRLLVPLIRANLLWLVALPISLWAAGDPAPYLLPSARHTALVQLPRLRAQQGELEAVICAVAG